MAKIEAIKERVSAAEAEEVAAKAALAKAEKKANKKKPSAEDLTAAAAAAKTAYKADKSAANKTAMKEAKAAAEGGAPAVSAKVTEASARVEAAEAELVAAKAALVKGESKASKKRKPEVSVEDLQEAAKSAKKAYKADKTAANKTAMKEAKAAAEAAEGGEATPAAVVEVAKVEAVEEVEDEVMVKKGGAAAAKSVGADNPTACSKVFLGNLSFQIDDDTVKDFFKDCGEIIETHWIEDKETGRFKGCGFATFTSPDAASLAVAMTGQDCMGRDIRVDFSLPRAGRDGGAKNNGASKFGSKPLSERPEGCTTVFAGNLSFNIDDDQMRTFAEDCGEIKALRWLTDRDSGDFKGCGFIEFYDEAAVDKFVLKNGVDCMGRPIRLDYSAPKKSY
jgi:nucleolin